MTEIISNPLLFWGRKVVLHARRIMPVTKCRLAVRRVRRDDAYLALVGAAIETDVRFLI